MFLLEFDVSLQGSQEFTVSSWVRLFRWLGGGVKFPLPETPDSEIKGFATGVTTLPVILIVVGFIVSLTMLIALCCCRGSGMPDGSRPPKPSALPTLCLANFVFGFIFISSVACLAVGNSSYTSAVSELDRAASDLSLAVSTGQVLSGTGDEVLQSISLLEETCPQQWSVAGHFTTPMQEIQNQTKGFKEGISSFIATVEPITAETLKVQEHQGTFGGYLLACLALPMALVTVTCCCIISAVVAVRCFGGSGFARCCDLCCLRLGSLCISLAILLAVVVASAQIALGIGISSFCADADGTAMSYALHEFGADSIEFKAAQYYITKAGDNPILQELNVSESNIDAANKSFQRFCDLGGLTMCSEWSPDILIRSFSTIENSISSCKEIVQFQNIFSYYDRIVHKNSCGAVVGSLGWLVVVQLVGGLLLLPALATASASFFTRWSAWKAYYDRDCPGGPLIEFAGRG